MAMKLRFPPLAPSKDPASYPAFTGGVSRWLWAIYTQRFTPAGRWFLLASLGFAIYGGASLQLQGYVLAAYTAVLWAVAIFAMLLYRPRVILRPLLADRVAAGQKLLVDLEVEQRGRFRGADLVVIPHRLPGPIDSLPDDGVALPDLGRGEHARVRVGLLCKRRGEFILKGFRVESGFPFGILRARRTFHERRRLLVYPQFTPLTRLNLPAGRRYQPGGIAMASHLGESFEYLGNREFRDGDSVRDIDWRATARIGRPIVREWIEEYMLRAAVILDTHVPFGLGRVAQQRRDSFERAVSVAAAVSDYMARQDYLVDIFAAGPNLYHLTAGRSLAYLDQILDILACVNATTREPFDVIEPQIGELISKLSVVICVFLDWNDVRRVFAHRLREQGVALKVIVLREGPCTEDPAADADALGEVPVIGQADYDRGMTEL